ncbi:MAG: GDP-L-fucose synthase [Candidatus Anstonellales archaeon]
MDKDSKIYIAGKSGLVGSAIYRELINQGYRNIVYRSSKTLDLRNKLEVDNFFRIEKPEYVFMCAGVVGGIKYNNTNKVKFLYDNMVMGMNVINASHTFKVKKLLYMGSSCIYPRNTSVPIKESQLLSGYLEKTNEAYALAKIANIKLCEYYKQEYGDNFISCIPTNVYGIGDTFDEIKSHVIPALLMRIHKAKINRDRVVEVWGTGNSLREFIYSDDLARACILIMKEYNDISPINIGTGREISIKDLAYKIKDIVGYEGELVFNANELEGVYRKVLDISKLNKLGWKAKVDLDMGLREVYNWYITNR